MGLDKSESAFLEVIKHIGYFNLNNGFENISDRNKPIAIKMVLFMYWFWVRPNTTRYDLTKPDGIMKEDTQLEVVQKAITRGEEWLAENCSEEYLKYKNTKTDVGEAIQNKKLHWSYPINKEDINSRKGILNLMFQPDSAGRQILIEKNMHKTRNKKEICLTDFGKKTALQCALKLFKGMIQNLEKNNYLHN